MAKKQTKELVQTKSAFKLQGLVTRIDKEHAYTEGEGREGTKNEGKQYRSLKLGIKTSDTNEIFVQMFSFEPEKVFLWNSKLAKEAKDNGEKYKGVRMDYEDFVEERDELREEGFALLESRIGLGYKTIKKDDGTEIEVVDEYGELKWEAIKKIYEAIDNDDSVEVEGDISYSTYTNKEGKETLQKNLNITRFVILPKEIDFDDEKFEEITYFEQEAVYVGVEKDKKSGKVYVTGRTIDYLKKTQDVTFVINTLDEDGKVDPDLQGMADAFGSKIKPYDVIQMFGDVYNRTIVKEVEGEEEEKSNSLALLGGKKKPKYAETYSAKTYQQEMSVIGIGSWDKKVYKEEDFVASAKANTVIKKDEDADEEVAFGKGKKTNPFENKDKKEATLDLDDDDLPF